MDDIINEVEEVLFSGVEQGDLSPVFPDVIVDHVYPGASPTFLPGNFFSCNFESELEESSLRIIKEDFYIHIRYGPVGLCNVILSTDHDNVSGTDGLNPVTGDFGMFQFSDWIRNRPDLLPCSPNENVVWDNKIWPVLMNSQEFAKMTMEGHFMLPVFPTIGIFVPININVTEHGSFDTVQYSYRDNLNTVHEIAASTVQYPMTLNQIRLCWINWFKSEKIDFGEIRKTITDSTLDMEDAFNPGANNADENSLLRRLASAYLSHGLTPDVLAHAALGPADAVELGWNGR